MQELEFTPKRLLKIWWAATWRGAILGGLAGALGGILMGLFVLFVLGWADPHHLAGLVGGSMGGLPAGYVAIRSALRKEYREFRIALISTS